MKINLAQIWTFLKKNWKYTALVLAVLFFSVRGCVKDNIIKKQTETIVKLETDNFKIGNDRLALELRLRKLQEDYSSIHHNNDSLRLLLKKYQADLEIMKKKHEQEIADLLAVPADTIYVRLNELFPNYDMGDARFRFSESQIKPIYKTSLEYPMLQAEYLLQRKSLSTCLGLNTGYETGITNLNSQIETLKTDIAKCDTQVSNFQAKEVVLNRQIASNKFWKKTLLITTGILTGIVILK